MHPAKSSDWVRVSRAVIGFCVIGALYLGIHAAGSAWTKPDFGGAPSVMKSVPPTPSVLPAVWGAALVFIAASIFVNLMLIRGSVSLPKRILVCLVQVGPSALVAFVVGGFLVLNLESPWVVVTGVAVGLLTVPGQLAHGLWLQRYVRAVEALDRAGKSGNALETIKSMLIAYSAYDEDPVIAAERAEFAQLAAHQLERLGRADQAADILKLAR